MLPLALAAALALGQTAERQRALASGECLWWRQRTFSWLADAPDAGEYDAIDRALAEWRSKLSACTGFDLPPAVRVSDAGTRLGTTLIFRHRLCRDVVPALDPCFDDESCGDTFHCWQHSVDAVTAPRVTFDPRTGELRDADLELNAAGFVFTPNDDGGLSWDVQSAVTSGTGFALGLDYVLDPTSVMYRNVTRGQRRVVDPASAAALCAAYPTGEPPQRCDGGAVLLDAGAVTPAPDAGTPCNPSAAISGCNADEQCSPTGGGDYACRLAPRCGCGSAQFSPWMWMWLSWFASGRTRPSRTSTGSLKRMSTFGFTRRSS